LRLRHPQPCCCNGFGGEGFENVFSMEGGIRAWEGLVAEGSPEAGMAYFTAGGRPGSS